MFGAVLFTPLTYSGLPENLDERVAELIKAHEHFPRVKNATKKVAHHVAEAHHKLKKKVKINPFSLLQGQGTVVSQEDINKIIQTCTIHQIRALMKFFCGKSIVQTVNKKLLATGAFTAAVNGEEHEDCKYVVESNPLDQSLNPNSQTQFPSD